MIKRRSATEPVIGHMKTGGRLGRNWLKVALGAALHAALCSAGHNVRLLLRALRLFCVRPLAMLLAAMGLSLASLDHGRSFDTSFRADYL
jgi:IS5 family transposase